MILLLFKSNSVIAKQAWSLMLAFHGNHQIIAPHACRTDAEQIQNEPYILSLMAV
jgi:hypothetical protein